MHDGGAGGDGRLRLVLVRRVVPIQEQGSSSTFQNGNHQLEPVLKSQQRLIVIYNNIEKLVKIQGDHSGRLQPPVDLVPTVLAASGPLLQLPTAQGGDRTFQILVNRRL